MIAYCCAACEQCLSVDSVIAVVPPGYVDEFNVIKDRYRLTKVVQVVTGGTTRRASVANGLAALDNDTDIVAIHDAARPCITHTLIEKAVCAAGNAGAVLLPFRLPRRSRRLIRSR